MRAERKNETAVLAAFTEGLDHQHGFECIQTASTPFVWNGKASKPKGSGLVPNLAIETAFGIAFSGAGIEALTRKSEGGLDPFELGGCEVHSAACHNKTDSNSQGILSPLKTT